MARNGGLPRWVEVPVAALSLVIVSPVLLFAAAAIKTTSKGPVLFKQRRVGSGGRQFTILKLRTMRQNVDGLRVTVRGDSRVTTVGRWLRHFKLDEVPELWNVVRGDMSLVGPRPEVPEYVNQEDELWRPVLRVRPGITDPVTLRLRNEEELLAAAGGNPDGFYREILQPFKLVNYASYLKQRTWRTDLGVIWATFRAVLGPGSVGGPSAREMRECVHRWETRPR
jgi:lipopolysaccharide/colanic/teichoic acid biosynthesis glycosyltransferase